jgi:hypothetical protein
LVKASNKRTSSGHFLPGFLAFQQALFPHDMQADESARNRCSLIAALLPQNTSPTPDDTGGKSAFVIKRALAANPQSQVY